jgi:hypothetical protein
MATKIADFEDGVDKIAYSTDNGATYIANPFSDNGVSLGTHTLASQTQLVLGNPFTMVYDQSASNEFLFYTAGNVTFTDDDVTTVVA